MRSLVEQLESNEAILLMYLAGELADTERAAVEQMLERDANLRAELERLRAAEQAVGAALARLDASQPLPRSEAAGVRQVGRMISQWQARRLSRPARPEPDKPALRFPYWSYPLAAAAAVTIAFVTWWYNLPEPGRMPLDIAEMAARDRDISLPPDVQVVDLSEGEPVQFASLDWLDDSRGLSELESELRQLEYLRESMQ